MDLNLVREWLTRFQEVVDTHDPLEVFEKALEGARRAMDKASGSS